MNLRRHLPVLVLVAAALLLRYLTQSEHLTNWWVNVAPVMALCLVGGALLPGASRWAILPGLVAVDFLVAGSDLMQFALLLLVTYLCYALAITWGGRLQQRVSGAGLLGRLLVASFGFYLLSNTASWALSPGYARTAAGWIQAMTVGLPGFPPTWLFFRNSLLSDLGFGSLLILAHNLGQGSASSRTGTAALGVGAFIPWMHAPGREREPGEAGVTTGTSV